jgi:hypothetical protein
MDLRTQHEQWELYLLFLRQNLNTGKPTIYLVRNGMYGAWGHIFFLVN